MRTRHHPFFGIGLPGLVVTLLPFWIGLVQASEHRPFGIGIGFYSPPAARPTPVDARQASLTLEALGIELEKQVAERGAYDPAAGEWWLGAAEQAFSLGDYQLAEKWFGAALHNLRLNEGLQSASQLTIVERLIAAARYRGDRAQLADRVDYRFRLLGLGKSPYDETILAAANDWLAVRTELLVVDNFNPRTAHELYDRADTLQSAVCDDPQWRASWCRAFSFRLLGVMTVIDWYVRPLVQDTLGPSTLSAFQRYDPVWDDSPIDHKLQTLNSTIGGRARRIFENWRTHFPTDDHLRLIAADWDWVHGRRAQALSAYRDLHGRHPQWFSRPAPLPDLPNLTPDPRLASDSEVYALRCQINGWGRATQIELTSELGAGAGTVRRQLREVKFRPAFDATGEPVEAYFEAEIVGFRH
jgi:hypothetical protein